MTPSQQLCKGMGSVEVKGLSRPVMTTGTWMPGATGSSNGTCCRMVQLRGMQMKGTQWDRARGLNADSASVW